MLRKTDARGGAALRSGLLLLMAILSAGAAAAETVERAYAFATVTAGPGALPVAGLEGGLLLDRAMDESCRVTSTGPASPAAIATTTGTTVTLSLEILGCRVAAAPHARCQWSIEPPASTDASCRSSSLPTTSGKGSWKGWQGELELRAPAKTGRYELTVSCSLKGKEATSEQSASLPFYVTYAEPLFAFSPPEVEWYERACCWGGGFAAGASEVDVLEALVKGLYRYGGAHWRYGYGEKVGDGRYTFPLHDAQGGRIELEYHVADHGLRPKCFSNCHECCRCHWKGLVAERTSCDFGDCYMFSGVLSAMAGVMGIGGLIPIEIDGLADQGFVTIPGRSLDPRFPGNVFCPGKPSCPYPYYFGSHSLRRRDRLYFDATFGRTYTSPEEPIALNVDHRSPCATADALSFLDNDTIMFIGKPGYGQWPYVTDPGIFCGLGLQGVPPVLPVVIDAAAVFEPMNLDDDGDYERLTALLRAEVVTEGTYLFFGQLFDAERNEVVASKPHWDSIHLTTGSVSGPPGHYRFELSFSGQEIYESGKNGPYWLRVHLGLGHEDERSVVWIKSPRFEYDKFGELAVEALDMQVSESIDRSQPLTALPIDVNFGVRQAGDYVLQSRLAKDGVTISYTGWKKDLIPTYTLVTLEIPGAPIAASGLDGPYELTLEIYDSELAVVEAQTLLVEGFDAASFAAE